MMIVSIGGGLSASGLVDEWSAPNQNAQPEDNTPAAQTIPCSETASLRAQFSRLRAAA
ncbi:hypothetical protein B0G80_5500 [Paraburkholderia sp. BL6669N2]|nr:hypothetical protein B0G80_5500 [Paraburkholderia sp. BL6669N2]